MADFDVEGRVSAAPAHGANVGVTGSPKAKADRSTGEAYGAEIDGDSVTTRIGLGGDQEVEEDQEDLEVEDEASEGDEETTSEDGGEKSEEEAESEGDEASDDQDEDLGEYDPTDEEKISKFDAKYLREDGTLDVNGKLSEEFWANSAKGTDGLNEATYAYLRDRFGIDKETVKDIEAAQKAKAASVENEVHAKFGGKQNFDAAMEWARKGGYTKPQRDRFNAITKSNDPEAIDEALVALEARWRKATKPASEATTERPAAKPKRDVTSSATRKSDTIEVFPTKADWQTAFNAADKNDAAVMADIRRRMKASPWWKADRRR